MTACNECEHHYRIIIVGEPNLKGYYCDAGPRNVVFVDDEENNKLANGCEFYKKYSEAKE